MIDLASAPPYSGTKPAKGVSEAAVLSALLPR